LNFQVLFEDNHLLVVSKPPGLLVQPDFSGAPCLIDGVKAYIKEKYNKPGAVYLGLPHRIDRPTSGVVVMARTTKAMTRLSAYFRDREVSKTYLAVVKKAPALPQARLEHWLKKNEKLNRSYAYPKEVPGSKQALLTYTTLGQTQFYTLLQVDLETGRHHQIRCQLSAIGSPIKGDVKYGAQRPNPDGSIHLLAWQLTLEHPVLNTPMTFYAPLPDDPVWKACAPFLPQQ
jgi:23S rRNA pseudouridine1911/1915/1917 synthase